MPVESRVLLAVDRTSCHVVVVVGSLDIVDDYIGGRQRRQELGEVVARV